MARVPARDPEEVPEEYRRLVYRTEAREETANVFRTVANNPAVLDSFRKYFGVLWTEAGLTPRERELVILATARQARSPYEWHQHVRLGRKAGLDDEAIRAVGSEDYGALSDREALLVQYTRAVAADAVDDDLHARASEEFDESTLVGTVMLASGYAGLAKALSALEVELEEGFVGWELERR